MCRSPNSSANHGLADGTRSVPATFVGHVRQRFLGVSPLGKNRGLTPNGTDFTRKVAGTFHVPSAKLQVTAHGMCLLLSKVSAIGLAPPRSETSHLIPREAESSLRPTRTVPRRFFRHDWCNRCHCTRRYDRDGPFREAGLAKDSQFPCDVT